MSLHSLQITLNAQLALRLIDFFQLHSDSKRSENLFLQHYKHT